MPIKTDRSNIAERFLEIERKLADQLLRISVKQPVKYVYNPIDYARDIHSKFVRKFLNGSPKPVLFLGMNPGPWGMAQTGIPFGEVSVVKEWLGIDGHVGQPTTVHPKKPIMGLECNRKEVSGERFWSLAKLISDSPEEFFDSCVVYNHCPLIFMTDSGKNVTVNEFKPVERSQINTLCDKALHDVLELFHTKTVVCLGRFAERRSIATVNDYGREDSNIRICYITHPSPSSPAANFGWAETSYETLLEIGVLEEI